MYRPETKREQDEERHQAEMARLHALERRLEGTSRATQDLLARMDARQDAARVDMAALNREQADILERLERVKESPVLDPKAWETTVEQVRHMIHRDTHPAWMQAAYADVAQRLERLDAQVTAMQTTLKDIVALLHVLPFRASPLGDDADATQEDVSDA